MKAVSRRLPFDGRGAIKATGEEIVCAYRETGSVWAAAKRLGMSGQGIWERLRALGHKMPGANWSKGELEELATLVGNCTIGEIASRLGRPYAGVACKISELHIGTGFGNQVKRKRVKGYSKRRVKKLINELESYSGSLRQFCRHHSLELDYFVKCLQRIDLQFWEDYTRRKSDLTPKSCPYCAATFYPLTKKQQTCSRRCSGLLRVDKSYFGGKRRHAIGLSEGVCQLCMTAKDRLSAHHMLGKENDPENNFLVALCAGCHQIVSQLAGRLFTDREEGWENLINLVMARRLADKNRNTDADYVGTHVAVDIEWLTMDEVTQFEESA